MRAQIEKYFGRMCHFVRRDKCIKMFQTVLRVLKIFFFAGLALAGLCFLGEASFDYGHYLLNQKQIWSACPQCSAFCIHFSFTVVVFSCLLLVFCALRPPKGFWFCLLVWLSAVFAWCMSADMWSFSLNPAAYRFPDEVIIYGVRVREDFILVCVAWLYALQVYLKPALRKYILPVSVPVMIAWIVWNHISQLYPYY